MGGVPYKPRFRHHAIKQELTLSLDVQSVVSGIVASEIERDKPSTSGALRMTDLKVGYSPFCIEYY